MQKQIVYQEIMPTNFFNQHVTATKTNIAT